MNRISSSLLAACCASVLCSLPATAAMVAGDGGATASRRNTEAPPKKDLSTLDLIDGVIVSVDLAKKTMTVAGNTLAWHPTQLRIFGSDGARASERQLRPGMRVRFALEPGKSGARRVVLIMMDARS